MSRYLATILVVAIAVFQTTLATEEQNAKQKHEMSWWYEKPAAKYWEGLPIGTGRFAAMVLGGIREEQIVLNDETLWSGSPYNPNTPEGPKLLAEMRELLLKKEYLKADSVSVKFNSIPMRVQHYQPMSTLNLTFDNQDASKVRHYRRKLSLDSALVTITYQIGDVTYKREIFASYPDQVVVMRVSSSKPGQLNVTAWLSSLQPSAVSFVENKDVVMNGGTTELSQETYKERIIPSLMKWQSRVRINNEGGRIVPSALSARKNSNAIRVENADAITFIIAGATNWKSWNDLGADEKVRCADYINEASRKSFSVLKTSHLDDYCPLFSACKIDLGGDDAGLLNTSERMERLRSGGEDPLFVSQYFQFGRYLMLAGARENTLAFNNHNIWLNDMEGRWQGRWTLNINIQECYWPVESTNLPRINESLVLFAEQLAQAGARTAKEMFGCRGWVAHHGTDVWFNTAPTDGHPNASMWPMGGAWIMQQLYDHYLYEPDSRYLNRIYPLLKGSADFFLDVLVVDPATGWLVTNPSSSPENWFLIDGKRAALSMGSAMDIQIVRNLFRNCLSACKTLNRDSELQNQLEKALAKLPPHQIGKYGQLQEWLVDFDEADQRHRHLSHLFAAYPDDDISIFKTPELAKAVSTVLQRRGDTRLGWSGAWKINLHARLLEPEPAYDILKKMLTEVSLHPRDEDSRITPSFEGNQAIQGVTAGITELLMQSHSGELLLLPALPAAWKSGTISGLRARGGYTLDITWEDGRLKESTIVSKSSAKCRIRTKVPVAVFRGDRTIGATRIGATVIEFVPEAGIRYKIVPE